MHIAHVYIKITNRPNSIRQQPRAAMCGFTMRPPCLTPADCNSCRALSALPERPVFLQHGCVYMYIHASLWDPCVRADPRERNIHLAATCSRMRVYIASCICTYASTHSCSVRLYGRHSKYPTRAIFYQNPPEMFVDPSRRHAV